METILVAKTSHRTPPAIIIHSPPMSRSSRLSAPAPNTPAQTFPHQTHLRLYYESIQATHPHLPNFDWHSNPPHPTLALNLISSALNPAPLPQLHPHSASLSRQRSSPALTPNGARKIAFLALPPQPSSPTSTSPTSSSNSHSFSQHDDSFNTLHNNDSLSSSASSTGSLIKRPNPRTRHIQPTRSQPLISTSSLSSLSSSAASSSSEPDEEPKTMKSKQTRTPNTNKRLKPNTTTSQSDLDNLGDFDNDSDDMSDSSSQSAPSSPSRYQTGTRLRKSLDANLVMTAKDKFLATATSSQRLTRGVIVQLASVKPARPAPGPRKALPAPSFIPRPTQRRTSLRLATLNQSNQLVQLQSSPVHQHYHSETDSSCLFSSDSEGETEQRHISQGDTIRTTISSPISNDNSTESDESDHAMFDGDADQVFNPPIINHNNDDDDDDDNDDGDDESDNVMLDQVTEVAGLDNDDNDDNDEDTDQDNDVEDEDVSDDIVDEDGAVESDVTADAGQDDVDNAFDDEDNIAENDTGDVGVDDDANVDEKKDSDAADDAADDEDEDDEDDSGSEDPSSPVSKTAQPFSFLMRASITQVTPISPSLPHALALRSQIIRIAPQLKAPSTPLEPRGFVLPSTLMAKRDPRIQWSDDEEIDDCDSDDPTKPKKKKKNLPRAVDGLVRRNQRQQVKAVKEAEELTKREAKAEKRKAKEMDKQAKKEAREERRRSANERQAKQAKKRNLRRRRVENQAYKTSIYESQIKTVGR